MNKDMTAGFWQFCNINEAFFVCVLILDFIYSTSIYCAPTIYMALCYKLWGVDEWSNKFALEMEEASLHKSN